MKKTAKFHLDKKVISQWESDLRRMTKIYRSIPTDPARTWKYGEMFDNPDYEKNLQAWEEAQKLFVKYGRNIHDLVYDEMLPGPEKEKTWQERALREKAWGFLHDIRSSLFDRSYNYLTDKHEPDLPKLGKVRDTNVRRYQKSAREFFEALEDWLALKGGSHVSNRIEQMNLAGFQVRLYDATGSEGNIAFVKAGLEKYRERAQAYAPILIQNQVPINIYPNKSHGDAEASYDWGTKTISLWEWATISSRNINRLVWVLAHEMGHHVFKTALNNGQRDLWGRVIKGDYKDLDLREVIKKMRSGEDISDFIQRIKNEDPILQLQLETLWYNPSVKDLELFSIRDIIEYLEKGGNPMVRVPATPITQYAAKNPEEAFCEAIGVLVGLGPQGLHEKVRALLRIMIPSIRIATLGSSNFVARFGNVMENPSRTGRSIRKASNISTNIPASTIFDGGWEWDLPGFADWPKFKKLPKEKQIAWAKSFMAAGPKEPVEIAVYASGQVDFEDGHHRVMAGKILDLKIPVRVRFINFKPDWWPNLLELLEAGYSPRQYNPQGWNLSRAGVPPLEVVRKGRDAADDWIINEIERKQQEKDDREVRERAGQKSASFVSRKSADSRLLSSDGTSLEKYGLGGEKTAAFRGGVLLASDRMASTNEPTDPKLWDKVQALTKGEIKSLRHDGKTIQGPNDGKGFRIFPSAYANGWSSKIYKDLGGKWRKSKTARGEAKKDVGQGGLDEWFSGHGGDEGDATWGDWVAITPIKHKVDDKTYEPGDIVGPCGISSDAAWKEITNNGKDPLKCMPRNKAHDMPKENRAELAKEKQKAEEEGSNRGKKPTNTPTFSEEADELLEKSARMKQADSRSDAEKDAIFSKWKDLINMTEKELNSWAKDPNRLEASLSRDEAEDLSKSKKDKIQSGYDSLHRIKRRVSKPQQEWSDEDYDNAAQENGFNQRMIGNKPGDPIGDTGMAKWEISLRNWGHDPSKASSPAHSKWKSWSRKNKLKMASTSRDSMRNSVAGNRSILTTHAGSNMNLSKIAQRVAAKKLENNLSRPVIKKINAAIDKAGLTGRLMFPGSRAGWAKVFEVLGDFGVTTDTIPYISGPSGDIRIFLRWINDEESEIDNTVLVFTWHKQQSEKYEILAYLS